MVQFFNAFGVDVFKLAFQVVNFLLLLWLLNRFLFKPVLRMLDERSDRIRRGLEDAEEARHERERSEAERAEALQAARREANDIIARATKAAQDLRDADLAATREELERIRERAAADIEAEKQRAIADLRTEVADLALAAAGKIIGDSMDRERQRRLVEEFLASPLPVTVAAGAASSAPNGRRSGGSSAPPAQPTTPPAPPVGGTATSGGPSTSPGAVLPPAGPSAPGGGTKPGPAGGDSADTSGSNR